MPEGQQKDKGELFWSGDAQGAKGWEDLLRDCDNQLKKRQININQLSRIEVLCPLESGCKPTREKFIQYIRNKRPDQPAQIKISARPTKSVYDRNKKNWFIHIYRARTISDEAIGQISIKQVIESVKSFFSSSESESKSDKKWADLFGKAIQNSVDFYKQESNSKVGKIKITVFNLDLHQYLSKNNLIDEMTDCAKATDFFGARLKKLGITHSESLLVEYTPPIQANEVTQPVADHDDILIQLFANEKVQTSEEAQTTKEAQAPNTQHNGSTDTQESAYTPMPRKDVTPLLVVQAGPVVTIKVLGTWVEGELKRLDDPFDFDLKLEECFSHTTLVQKIKNYESILGRVASDKAQLGFEMKNNVLVLKPQKKEVEGQLQNFYFIKGQGNVHPPLVSPHQLTKPIQIIVNGPEGPLQNGQWPLVIEIARCGAA